MKQIDWNKVQKGIKDFARIYPVEIIVCTVLFAFLEVLDAVNYSDRELQSKCFYFPIVICAVYACNNFFRQRFRNLYYGSLILLLPVLLVSVRSYTFTVGYGFGLLLASFLLLLCRPSKDNRQFANVFVATLTDLVGSFIAGIVIYVILLLIFASLHYIFDVFPSYNSHIAFVVISFSFPFTFLFMQMRRTGRTSASVSRFISAIINYAVCPAIVIYTIILYAYFIRIVAFWELPLGGVALMVMAFYIVALMGRMMQNVAPMKIYSWYFDNFSYISIPLLVLFWTGLLYRVNQYSLTQSRVYLVAAGILMVLCSAMLLSRRFGRYKLIMLLASGCIILLTYIPGISARSISIYCQRDRFEKYVESLRLLDSRTNEYRSDIGSLLDTPEKENDYKQFRECCFYLKDINDSTFVDKYGDIVELPSYEEGKVSADFNFNAPRWVSTQGYPFFCKGASFAVKTEKEDNAYRVKLYQSGTLLLNEPVKTDLINKYRSLKKEELPAEAITFKNDSVMLVSDNLYISGSKGRYNYQINEWNCKVFTSHPLRIEE